MPIKTFNTNNSNKNILIRAQRYGDETSKSGCYLGFSILTYTKRGKSTRKKAHIEQNELKCRNTLVRICECCVSLGTNQWDTVQIRRLFISAFDDRVIFWLNDFRISKYSKKKMKAHNFIFNRNSFTALSCHFISLLGHNRNDCSALNQTFREYTTYCCLPKRKSPNDGKKNPK